MSDVTRRSVPISGLTEAEAKEFHSLFITSFLVFVAVAVVAHFLVYSWRPWLPPVGGYATSLNDGAMLLKSFFA